MKNSYESPFSTRYASKEMQYIFSPDKKFRTWRRLWIALAETEKELGLNITQEQIDEMIAFQDDINYDVAEAREKLVRHDVMSHVYAYGIQCPNAKGIIHLGATSCYVGDNTDVIIMKEALQVIRRKLINVIDLLSNFAEKYKAMPALAYTHLQPAQLTTVGKRATLWINELLMDLEDLEYRISTLKLLGSKGTTGTQASFVDLFEGDTEKVTRLEQMIAEEKEITVRTEITPDIYAQVDESFYIRMVVNLVSNAVFYGREGGIVKISLQVKEENVVGIVEDNGIGISVHDMEHIWERFYRADTSRTDGSHSGLGLSMVKWIAEAHGGRVSVESREGEGSRFTFYIPF